MIQQKTLVIIAGPTAVGKTAIAIRLAQHYKTVVISADSRQFYREMSVGTAKPGKDELTAVQHYFINSHSIRESFSVGDFEKQALALLDELFKKHDIVIMAGGSGLYVKAVCEGFDELPVADPGTRHRLNQDYTEQGIIHLQKRLKDIDPDYYERVDIHNPRRIIRALEVFETTGKPITFYRRSTENKRLFNIVKIALNLPRHILYQRINLRVDQMVEQGLVAEVRSLFSYRYLNALNTVGYSELFDHFDGKISLETAIELIKQNTRHFAKRQLTWFRKDKDFHWLGADDDQVMTNAIMLIDQSQ